MLARYPKKNSITAPRMPLSSTPTKHRGTSMPTTSENCQAKTSTHSCPACHPSAFLNKYRCPAINHGCGGSSGQTRSFFGFEPTGKIGLSSSVSHRDTSTGPIVEMSITSETNPCAYPICEAPKMQKSIEFIGAPDTIRTCDLCLRRPNARHD